MNRRQFEAWMARPFKLAPGMNMTLRSEKLRRGIPSPEEVRKAIAADEAAMGCTYAEADARVVAALALATTRDLHKRWMKS